jgi:hypothetical protein
MPSENSTTDSPTLKRRGVLLWGELVLGALLLLLGALSFNPSSKSLGLFPVGLLFSGALIGLQAGGRLLGAWATRGNSTAPPEHWLLRRLGWPRVILLVLIALSFAVIGAAGSHAEHFGWGFLPLLGAMAFLLAAAPLWALANLISALVTSVRERQRAGGARSPYRKLRFAVDLTVLSAWVVLYLVFWQQS